MLSTCFYSSIFIFCHKFSIILRYGLWAGHSIPCILFCSKYPFTMHARWTGALVYLVIIWKTAINYRPYDVVNYFNIFCGINISIYQGNVPTPSYVIKPPIIKLAPRPGFKHWGVHSSSGRFHIKTRLSMPSFTLLSSLKITLFQWSVTVLCLFNLHS